MRASRGMGNINPAKMPKNKARKRRDSTPPMQCVRNAPVKPTIKGKK